MLRFKARTGDNEPEVITECLCGLLTCSPKESLPFVTQFLDSGNMTIREAAVIALGRSRLSEAFDLLESLLAKAPIGLNETIFLAMAMLRLPAANGFLLELVASGEEPTSSAALSALLIHRYDPSLRKLIADAVCKSGSHLLLATFERDSATGD